MKRIKPLLKNILLSLLSTGIAVLLLEMAVRFCHPPEIFGWFFIRGPMFTGDPYVNYRLRENLHIEFTKGFDFKTTLETNSRGLRDREFSDTKPNGTYRVLVLGDSVTFGFGVEGNETYPKVLETLLNSSPGTVSRRFEVINTGVPGYGISHMLEYTKHYGLKLNPDLVIAGIIVDDLARSFSVCSPQGQLRVPEGASLLKKAKNLLYNNSALYAFLEFRYDSFLQNIGLRAQTCYWGPASDLALFPFPERARKVLEEGERKILEIRTLTESRGGRFMVAIFPCDYELDKARAARYKWIIQDPTRIDFDSPRSSHGHLHSFLRDNGIPYITLVPLCLKKTREGERLFLLEDAHHNKKAQAIFAKEIFSFLAQNKVRFGF